MKIGNINIKNKVALAPMAGISNASYISLATSFGLGLAFTELISAEAIIRGNKKTFDMLKGIDDLDIPVGIQIFGSNENSLAQAAKIINDLYPNTFIDINMGCPVPKVAIKNKAGSYLLKDEEKVRRIVSKVVSSVKCPVTVKIRSGWDENSINAVRISKIIEESGASAISIHARTRSQGYSGKANWDIIKEVKENVNIPVIGNGDIKSAIDAKKMIDLTSCDMVMVGRGAIGNPFIFKEILDYLEKGVIIEKPSNGEKIDVCLKHLKYLMKYKSEKSAVLEMRMHVPYYLKSIPLSKEIKSEIFKTKKASEIEKILLDYKKMC